jgi:hypothetical protein
MVATPIPLAHGLDTLARNEHHTGAQARHRENCDHHRGHDKGAVPSHPIRSTFDKRWPASYDGPILENVPQIISQRAPSRSAIAAPSHSP